LTVVRFDFIPSKPLLRGQETGQAGEVSRFLRHANRAFGSLPYQTASLPASWSAASNAFRGEHAFKHLA
jgi:hypothetical protein